MRHLIALLLLFFSSSSWAAAKCGESLGFLEGPGTVQTRYIVHNKEIRNYAFFTPRGVPDQSPLIVLLHPYGTTGSLFANYVDVTKAAHDRCAIVIAPSGNALAWNAGSAKTGSTSDDVGFIMAAIADYKSRNPSKVDADRQYLLGMSNGGNMAYRMACERSSSFAAMTVVAGSMGRDPLGRISTEPGYAPAFKCDNAADPLKPSHPMPLFVIHGKRDACLKYDGGALAAPNASVLIPSVPKVAQEWAAYNGCPETDITAAPEILRIQTSGPDVGTLSCRQIVGCANGSMVKHCSIEEGGHRWPGASPYYLSLTCSGDGGLASADDLDATREAFGFFLDNSFRLTGLQP